ncbi:UDP-N-acetylmuramoylalanine--D-glutamate ligase [Streptomyces fumanus]
MLSGLGARVTVVADGADERARAQAAPLEELGVTVRLGDGDTLPEGTDLVVTAPGWRPDKPLFTAAREAGVPVWGDVELAWRLRGENAAPATPSSPSPARNWAWRGRCRYSHWARI